MLHPRHADAFVEINLILLRQLLCLVRCLDSPRSSILNQACAKILWADPLICPVGDLTGHNSSSKLLWLGFRFFVTPHLNGILSEPDRVDLQIPACVPRRQNLQHKVVWVPAKTLQAQTWPSSQKLELPGRVSEGCNWENRQTLTGTKFWCIAGPQRGVFRQCVYVSLG